MMHQCPIDEQEKNEMLSRLSADLKNVLDCRWRLQWRDGEDEYRLATDAVLKELINIIAQEYVELYEIAPIDH